MNIAYTSGIGLSDWDSVSSLFDAVGWSSRVSTDVRDAFTSSLFTRFAICDGDTIACGRAVGDGRYYAWIVDLAVHPDFQNRGVGSRILADLTEELRHCKTVSLVASNNVVDFYKKRGWHKQRDASMRRNNRA